MTLSEQIGKLRQRRKEISDRHGEILKLADEKQEGKLTKEQAEEYDKLEAEDVEVTAKIGDLEKELKRRQDHSTRQAELQKSAGRNVPAGDTAPPPQTQTTQQQPQQAPVIIYATPRGRGGFYGHDGADLSIPGLQSQGYGDQRGIVVARMVRSLAASRGDQSRAAMYARDILKDERVALAMEAGSFGSGGFIVPETYTPEIIELLRARSVVRRMGPTEAPLVNGNLTLPKLTGGATASYIGESQNIPKSQLTGGQVKATAKKLVALVPVSNDLLRFASPSADTMVRNDLVRAMAVTEDGSFIRDDGTGNAPKGLRYWAPSANVIAANGTVNLQNVDTDLGKLILALLNANVMLDNPGWLMAPRTWNYLETLRDGNGNKAFPEIKDGMLKGYPYEVTTQIPTNLGGGTNESELYFTNFADVVIAEDPRFELEASNVAAYHDGSAVVAAFSQDQTVVRVIANHDLILRHAEAVAVLTGVTWGG